MSMPMSMTRTITINPIYPHQRYAAQIKINLNTQSIDSIIMTSTQGGHHAVVTLTPSPDNTIFAIPNTATIDGNEVDISAVNDYSIGLCQIDGVHFGSDDLLEVITSGVPECIRFTYRSWNPDTIALDHEIPVVQVLLDAGVEVYDSGFLAIQFIDFSGDVI